ncbi:hypothetical protein YC2023_024288 [Brassica napus]
MNVGTCTCKEAIWERSGNKKQQTVEKMEGDGGVRAPSLVELTVEDSEFTVVGRVKGGDEALHDRIRHLVSQVEASSLNEESVTATEDLDEHANEEEEVE